MPYLEGEWVSFDEVMTDLPDNPERWMREKRERARGICCDADAILDGIAAFDVCQGCTGDCPLDEVTL